MLNLAAETRARVSNKSHVVLDHILSHEECDVDPINKLESNTPLHLAVKLEDPEARAYFVEMLLDAGADYTCVPLVHGFYPRDHDLGSCFWHRIRNKHGDTALDLVEPGDEDVALIFRKFQAESNIDDGDIACTSCA